MRSDVLVVGAGAAGLAAARRLASSNCKVTILEARDRLGGRIWSYDRWGDGDFIDLGAEFIHDSVLAQCFSKSGLIEIDERQRVQWDDWDRCRYEFAGRQIRRSRASPSVALVMDEKWYGRLRGAQGSVAQTLRGWPALARRMATADMEGLSAADANDLNARALYEQYRWWQGGERHWWPLGGYRRLIDKLAKNLARRIHMAHAVTKIERMVDGGRVRVTTWMGGRTRSEGASSSRNGRD